MADNTKDALGDEIEIGGVYAYHRCTNGYSTNVVGTVNSIDKGKAKIAIIERWCGMYEAGVKPEHSDTRVTTVKANSLFKLKERFH